MAADPKRKALIAKIRALLQKTVENGCTEEEMNAALALAKRLMDQADLDETDLSLGGEGADIKTRVVTDFDKIRYELYTPVGRFCHCASWKHSKSADTISFCGLESETIFAHWLLDMLADFVLYSVTRYGEKHRDAGLGRMSRDKRAAFIVGCSRRIAERLRDLTPRPVPGNGRDLLVIRDQLIERELAEQGIKLRDSFKLYSLDPKAYADGEAAGDRAQFNRPVDGMHERRLLS